MIPSMIRIKGAQRQMQNQKSKERLYRFNVRRK